MQKEHRKKKSCGHPMSCGCCATLLVKYVSVHTSTRNMSTLAPHKPFIIQLHYLPLRSNPYGTHAPAHAHALLWALRTAVAGSDWLHYACTSKYVGILYVHLPACASRTSNVKSSHLKRPRGRCFFVCFPRSRRRPVSPPVSHHGENGWFCPICRLLLTQQVSICSRKRTSCLGRRRGESCRTDAYCLEVRSAVPVDRQK